MPRTQKKENWRFIMNNERCPSTSENALYVAWRKSVKKRDGEKCILCDSTNRIQVHHIEKWADKPHIRFDINNGVSLCYNCHLTTFKREEEYEYIFKNYILKLKNKNLVSNYELYIKNKYGDSNGQKSTDSEV